MNLKVLVDQVKAEPTCRVLAPAGLPAVSARYVCPPDLLEFYSLCGGISLFESSAYSMRLSSPAELVPANPVIRGEPGGDDISSAWHVIGWGENSQYLTIDLHPERLGRCYDSFWDSHAIQGSCPVIALSFSDLLEALIRNKGEHWYWLQPSFRSLGDAYD
jgi:antitoxin YokJ